MTYWKTNPKIKDCNNQTPPPLHPSDQWVPIGTGNYYKGKWNHRTMSGNGIYVVPDGTVYNGNFEDGLFHGIGTMYYPSGSRIEGVWEKGKCVERNYIFSDGLRFQPNNWQYCKMPDRRYAIEHVNGFEPAAQSIMTNQQPTIEVPDGAYDAGDGFYQPLTNTVHDYWTKDLIRVPTVEGGKWIIENCRRGGKRVVGFRPELYENWYKSEENLRRDSDTTVPLDETMQNNESLMADIKSAPLSVLDLSLRNMWPVRKSITLGRWSSSSSSSSRTPSSSDSNIRASCWLDRRQKSVSTTQDDDDDRSSTIHVEPESSAIMDKQL